MIIKRFTISFLFIAMVYGGFTASAQGKTYAKDELSDMALIYQGGTHRPDWTVSELTPYVVHKFVDGTKEWFFDSFLFLEFETARPNGYGFGNGYGVAPARKTEWLWLLDRIFEKGKALDALNTTIGNFKAELGEPNFRHKIVLSLVVPCENQTNWGELNGNSLNFIYRSNQLEAEYWYINQLIERFNAAGYENFDLEGFYWLDESTAASKDLPTTVSTYIHDKGYKFYWIPYWNADGAMNWSTYGYDVAYQQPNHYFNSNILDTRLDDACRFAKQYGLGLEMEFESNVLYESVNSRYSRLESYINKFEENGVFAGSSIAYYSGTKAILDMYNSSHIENNQILDRIAKHIKERHAANASAITEVNQDTYTIATYSDGKININEGVKGAKCYSISGQLVAQGCGSFPVSSGFYIVSDENGYTVKLCVK